MKCSGAHALQQGLLDHRVNGLMTTYDDQKTRPLECRHNQAANGAVLLTRRDVAHEVGSLISKAKACA